MIKRFVLMFFCVASVFVLVGCFDTTEENTTIIEQDKKIASNSGDCLSCHPSQSRPYVESAHANPTYVYTSSGDSCVTCHATKIDNATEFDIVSVMPYLPNGGKAGQAGITCVGCHGFDSDKGHYDFSKDLDNATLLSLGTCGSCHDQNMHATYHPFGDNVTQQWVMSGHNRPGKSARNGSACALCHSGELFSALTIDEFKYGSESTTKFDELYAAKGARLQAEGVDLPSNPCQGCHDPHSGELRAKDKTVSGNVIRTNTASTNISIPATDPVTGKPVVVFSAEFNLCTTCHAVELAYTLDSTHATNTWDNSTKRFTYFLNPAVYWGATKDSTMTDIGGAGVTNLNALQPYHNAAGGSDTIGTRSFIDTHFQGAYKTFDNATPIPLATPYGIKALNYVDGYGINAASPSACSDCHDVHYDSKFNGNPTTVDYTPVATIVLPNALDLGLAGVTIKKPNTVTIATIAQNLKANHGNDKSGAFIRNGATSTACVRCHDGREAVKVFRGQTMAAQLDNNSSMLNGKSWRVVNCGTCHVLTANGKKASGTGTLGELRTFEKGTFSWMWDNVPTGGNTQMSATMFNRYNEKGSLLCINCHSGRRTGNIADFPQADLAAASGHYKPAGGIMTGMIFYRYPGKSYGNTGSYHYGNDTQCVSCHVVGVDNQNSPTVSPNDAMSHTFKVYDILGVPQNCANTCHNFLGLPKAQPAELAANKNGYTATVKLLGAKIAAYTGDNTTEGYLGAKANMAAFGTYSTTTLAVTLRDNGGNAHGGVMAKQILYDSLTFLGVPATDMAAVPEVQAWLCGGGACTTRPQ